MDGIYGQHPAERAASIALDRATNYGVVRLSLLEHLYEKIYMQRLSNPVESEWRCRILNGRAIVSACQNSQDSSIQLKLGTPDEKKQWVSRDEADQVEDLEVDYIFTATGYIRNSHEAMLESLKCFLPLGDGEKIANGERKIPVARDYRVLYDEEKVDSTQAGVWLQGCNERTHGVSL